MALGEQVYGFFIPTVTLMGIGAHKELANQIKTLGGKKTLHRNRQRDHRRGNH